MSSDANSTADSSILGWDADFHADFHAGLDGDFWSDLEVISRLICTLISRLICILIS